MQKIIKNKIMTKYISSIDILKIDENGKENWDTIEHVFEDENMIIARNKAIEDLKCLITFFSDDSYEEIRPYHVFEAVGNEYRYSNMFIPELTFISQDGWETELYGDIDTVIEGLENEASYYFQDANSYKMTKIRGHAGFPINVLESDLNFLLNNNLEKYKTKEFKTTEEEAKYLGCSEEHDGFKHSIRAVGSKLNELSSSNYYGYSRIYENGAIYGIIIEEITENIDIVYKSYEGVGNYKDLDIVDDDLDFESDGHHAIFLCILASASGWLKERNNIES